METIIEIIKWISSIGGLLKLFEMLRAYFDHQRQKNAYLQFMAQQFEYMDFLGQKSDSRIHCPRREDIYIGTRVKQYIRWSATHSQVNIKSDDNFSSIFKVLYKQSRQENRPLKLVILGPADSGKTTLMKWLALRCALRKKYFSHFIPIYISLDEPGLDLAGIYGNKNLETLVNEIIEKAGLKYTFFDKEFEKGRVMFLFDGLNRRGEEGCRLVNQWIQNQALGRNVLLISTRNTGADDSCIPDFGFTSHTLVIQDFNLEDIKSFLKKWFYTIEKKRKIISGHKSFIAEKQNSRDKCQYLVNMIEDQKNNIFQQLAVKPLCLTTMAMVLHDRGRLPEKLHELCKDTFRVFIKLMGNDHFPDNDTSVKTVMECLSKIAVLFLVKNRQEMNLHDMLLILHKDKLSFLLDEIVLKTGLLYKVQDRYGFTHVTFQELLAAWHFAKFSDYPQLLEFRNNENWAEVYKFFVNISEGNITRQFFNEIIQGLVEKQYWPRMLIWTNCLVNIADEKLQNDIEIQFARQIFIVLSKVKYRKENINENDERLVVYLYIPYPQFKHAMQFKNQAWDFFNHAEHPLVQTFGSSILHDISRRDPDEALKFITALKQRMIEAENHVNIDQDERFDFLYRNHNSVSLIIALRRNLLDFIFALEKLKSPHPFIKYLFLANFCNLLNILDTFELIVLPELKEVLTFLDARWFLKDLNPLVDLDFWGVRDFMTLQGFVELQTNMNLAAILDLPYIVLINNTMSKYENEFREKLKDVQISEKSMPVTEKIWHWLNHTCWKVFNIQIAEKPMPLTEKIKLWVNHAYKTLNSLPDKKLLKFFPGTTKAEINQFRTDYMKLSDRDRN